MIFHVERRPDSPALRRPHQVRLRRSYPGRRSFPTAAAQAPCSKATSFAAAKPPSKPATNATEDGRLLNIAASSFCGILALVGFLACGSHTKRAPAAERGWPFLPVQIDLLSSGGLRASVRQQNSSMDRLQWPRVHRERRFETLDAALGDRDWRGEYVPLHHLGARRRRQRALVAEEMTGLGQERRRVDVLPLPSALPPSARKRPGTHPALRPRAITTALAAMDEMGLHRRPFTMATLSLGRGNGVLILAPRRRGEAAGRGVRRSMYPLLTMPFQPPVTGGSISARTAPD